MPQNKQHHSSSVGFCVSCFAEQTEPFLKPVSLEQHPDYAEYIFHPMDLCSLEKVTSFSINFLFMPPVFFKLNFVFKNVKWKEK